MPMNLDGLGRILIGLGLFIALIGIFLIVGAKIPGLGRLPGDIYIRRGNFTFYFPLTTCILLSILLSVILRFLFRK